MNTRQKWLQACGYDPDRSEPSPGRALRDLKGKAHQLQKDAKAILKKAEDEGRAMNAAETRDFTQQMDDRDELAEVILEEEAAAEAELREFARSEGGVTGVPLTFTTAEGRQVPGVVAGQRFAAAAGARTEADISMGRAVMGMITGDQSMMEREMRAQVISQDPSGGFFVAPELSGMFIDLARARSVVSNAGAITVPLGAGETRIVRVTQDPVATWKAELAALNNTDVKFGSVVLYPKVLGCVVDISEELVQDGANAPAVIESILAQAVADQLDRSFFRGVTGGDGGGDVAGRYFTGILDDPDVGSVDLAGAAPTDYDSLIDAMQLVEDNNGAANVRIESPRTAAQLAKLKSATEGLYIDPPPSVAALRHLKSTQVPVDLGATEDESVSVVGDFRSAFVIIGIRSAFRVEVSREAGDAFENLGRKIRVWGRADMAIGRPSHLALIENIGA